MIIQGFLITFLLFAISRAILQLKTGNLTKKGFFFWLCLFIIAIIGVAQPQWTAKIAKFLGIGRGADVVVYLSIVLLFYLVFRLYVFLEDIRHEISELVRQISLKKIR